MIIMPVTEKEFNEFIDEVMKEFEEHQRKVDEGLRKINDNIDSVVESAIGYLSGDFKTQLKDAFKLCVTKKVPISKKLSDLSEKATENLAGLCNYRCTSDLEKQLGKSALKYDDSSDKKLTSWGIKSSPIPILSTFYRIACPPSSDHKHVGPDLRKRENWDSIIEKLKTEGEIVG